jgi:hypothetical protein
MKKEIEEVGHGVCVCVCACVCVCVCVCKTTITAARCSSKSPAKRTSITVRNRHSSHTLMISFLKEQKIGRRFVKIMSSPGTKIAGPY